MFISGHVAQVGGGRASPPALKLSHEDLEMAPNSHQQYHCRMEKIVEQCLQNLIGQLWRQSKGILGHARSQKIISTYPFLGSYWRICPLKREGTLWKRNTWVIVREGKGRERQRAHRDSEPEVQGGRHWKSMQHLGYFFLGGGSVFGTLRV